MMKRAFPGPPTFAPISFCISARSPITGSASYKLPRQSLPTGCEAFGHGIIGIPAALAGALSAAFGEEFSFLPLTPERMWRMSMEGGS
jgi:hypothetical protein